MLLVNDIPALVLFDLGASWSFIYLAFNKKFEIALKDLDHAFVVGISDSRFYHGCVLEIFQDIFPIDLVPIPFIETKIIVGMD